MLEVGMASGELQRLIETGALRIGTVLQHNARRYRDRNVNATVVRRGLRVANRVYETPSAAAKSVTRTPVDGWAFWRLPDGRRLDALRAGRAKAGLGAVTPRAGIMPRLTSILQEAAGEIVRVVVAGVWVDPRDDVPGAPPGIHDLDVVLDDGTRIAVEVTMATNQAARELENAVSQQRWVLPELDRSWRLVVRAHARIDALHPRIGPLLAELEHCGIERFNAPEPHDGPMKRAVDKLAHLGVRYARSSKAFGEPWVFVSTLGLGSYVDGSHICDALEQEATKPDNRRKLLAVGGGQLFVWIDHHAADAHAALCGDVSLPLHPPHLPQGIASVWAARYVLRPDGNLGAAVVLRGDPHMGWREVTQIVNDPRSE